VVENESYAEECIAAMKGGEKWKEEGNQEFVAIKGGGAQKEE